MNEKVTSYLLMGVALAMVVRYPDTISNAIVQFTGGFSSVVGGIVGKG